MSDDFFVVTLHVRFMKYVVFKAFGPLTRCKPNMNEEEWMHEKMDVLAFFFLKWPKRDVLFFSTFMFYHHPFFIHSFSFYNKI